MAVSLHPPIMVNPEQEALKKLQHRNAGAFPETPFPFPWSTCFMLPKICYPEAIVTLRLGALVTSF
jgi:hypothetical protein